MRRNLVEEVGEIGVGAAVVCYFAVLLKHRFGYDDALDVVALHLVGGIVGALAIGFLAHPDAPIGETGLLYGGGPGLLGRVKTYLARSRAERQLAQLDDRLLADIGMKRSEISKMVWGA